VGGASLVTANVACVEHESMFYVVTPTTFDPKSGACNDTPVCSHTDLLVGPNVGGDQLRCLAVTSGLIPRGKDDTNHTETNRIIVSEVDVEVFDGSGAVVDSFSRASNGVVDPSRPSVIQDSVLIVPVLRAEAAAKFGNGDQILIGIIIKGRTTGGTDIETPEYYLAAYGFTGGTCPADASSCC